MPGTFLAEFELYVTLAIARLGDGAYGGAIRDEIESRTGRPVSIGALYTTLARLEETTPDPVSRRGFRARMTRGLRASRRVSGVAERGSAGVPAESG